LPHSEGEFEYSLHFSANMSGRGKGGKGLGKGKGGAQLACGCSCRPIDFLHARPPIVPTVALHLALLASLDENEGRIRKQRQRELKERELIKQAREKGQERQKKNGRQAHVPVAMLQSSPLHPVLHLHILDVKLQLPLPEQLTPGVLLGQSSNRQAVGTGEPAGRLPLQRH
jgi:hypothetical protein